MQVTQYLLETLVHEGGKRLPGIIELCQKPVTYKVKLQDGKTVRRHITQIRKHSVDIQVTPESSAADQLPSNNTSNSEADSESDQSSLQPQPLQ